jgi:predicted RNA methylase
MISQSEIHSRINQIWQIFTAAGVTDPLTIIENLAYFFLREEFQIGDLYELSSSRRQLLESQQSTRGGFTPIDLLPDLLNKLPDLRGLPDIKQLVPQFTNSLGIDGYLKIGGAVHELLQDDSPAGQIFNEVLPGFLERMEPGGRYFTPRHLTRWVASLLETFPEARLADFACGSGGFLVAAAEKLPQVTGVEISPNWARLAFTNCLLHSIKKPDIRIGNSLAIFGKREKETKFDCILMNPPFGAKVDDSLVQMAFDFKMSGRSETVLTALACEHLSENGQMVVFVPSGSLFANSGGEQILREGWIENGELSAVISFPKDSFQPYSQTPTHALLIEKKARPDYVNWFFRPRYDGFTSGRNRQPDPENNDLPLIQTALQERNIVSEYWMSTDKQKGLMGEALFRNDKLIGYRITSQEAAQLKIIKLSSVFPIRENQFLAEKQDKDSTIFMLMNQVENLYGVREDSVPNIKTPLTLELNLMAKFAEDWDFRLELTPQGGTYIELLTNKTGALTYTEIDFSKTIGILINPDGSPLTPAFTLPKTFAGANAQIYYWYEETESPSGVLLTIPPKPKDSLKFLDSQSRQTSLIRINEESILGIILDENQTPHFSVYKVTNIRSSDEPIRGSVLDPEGVVIGIAVPYDVIQKKPNLDLQPISYFLQQDEMELRVLDSSAQILAEIQQSHFELTNQIKKLLNLSEMKPVSSDEIPPETIFANPIGKLLGFQKVIWDAIQTKVEHHQGKEIPIPFQLEDLDLPYSLPDIERTVNLFEQMGAMVKVSIMDVPYYRLISTRETRKGVGS